MAARDNKGQPRCQRHRPQETDNAALICALLQKLDTGLNETTLTEIVEQTAPKPFQLRALTAELTDRPDLLTGQGAYGSPRVLALIDALVAHGARTVIAPACPFCRRSTALNFRRDKARCCRRCYDGSRLQSCSACGQEQIVATRTPDGRPLCGSCMRGDPLNHESCAGCGRLALAVHHDEHGAALCGRCWRPPIATCSFCGKQKPCTNAGSDSPRCLTCQRTQNRAPCSHCGTVRIVWGRTSGKEPVCAPCGRPSEQCESCGRLRRVTGRTADGRALCRTCYRKHPASFRACTECGAIEYLHHRGLCTRCAAPGQLRAVLSGPDGSMRPELEPVIAALIGSDPYRLLVWIADPAPRRLLAELASGAGPVTHDALDQMTPSTALSHFRSILVANNALPERDEHLARFEQWLDRVLDGVDHAENKRLLRSFATWFHLRRLRRRSARRPLTINQIGGVRHEVRSSIRLLAWLCDHETDLSRCTQDDIDAWLSSDHAGKYVVRNFVTWAVENRHAHGIAIPTRSESRTRGQALLPEADQRWTLSKRLLHDTTLDTVDRVAGCLVVLYAQPCSRIVSLTVSHVTESDKGVHLHLGTRPLDIPEPLGDLVRELVRTRQGHAAVGHTDASPWLFPGGRPGRPMNPARLMSRLNAIGLPTRAGRGTALMDLAGQLPTTVLSRLLGIHIQTATAWSQEAGNTRPGYAAEVARRAHRRSE
ncbi:hypothetical protein H9Y04_44885 [Streptomyces sp. TRM66268-LWL]|uniref:Uncharacterized protein n=1 Tax=Streptomyces polyasparticus TaxID=2767826 RepID=A0ABR7SXD7_9ACTN|nr:hypothetical protein [Streptomyces polyasparticus]MBC9719627.1 hypothetical protein [Streptomyces polyasparticus]